MHTLACAHTYTLPLSCSRSRSLSLSTGLGGRDSVQVASPVRERTPAVRGASVRIPLEFSAEGLGSLSLSLCLLEGTSMVFSSRIPPTWTNPRTLCKSSPPTRRKLGGSRFARGTLLAPPAMSGACNRSSAVPLCIETACMCGPDHVCGVVFNSRSQHSKRRQKPRPTWQRSIIAGAPFRLRQPLMHFLG